MNARPVIPSRFTPLSRCRWCGYDLAAIGFPRRCPECGRDTRTSPSGGRVRSVVAVCACGVLLAAAAVLAAVAVFRALNSYEPSAIIAPLVVAFAAAATGAGLLRFRRNL